MEENIIKISMGEYYCTALRREPVEINISDYPVLLDMTIEDAANFAAILCGKNINEILPTFKTHWNNLSLTDFDLKRSIKRVELAAILNEYDVFNRFNVDIFGFYIK